jgi:hypothetical protein
MKYQPRAYRSIGRPRRRWVEMWGRNTLSLIYGGRRRRFIIHALCIAKNIRMCKIIQDVLGITNRLLSLIRRRPHWKRRVQKLFCCCVCIHYHGNVSTEPLPSNDRGIFTEPSRCIAMIRGYTYRHTDWWEGFFN